MKGPSQSFGYAPLSPVRQTMGQKITRVSDHKGKRQIGTDLLSQSLTFGTSGYKNVRCPSNIMKAGPPDVGADHFVGNRSSYMGSGFYHGKVHQSMSYSKEANQLVGTDTQYSSMENHREMRNLDFRLAMMEKSQLAHSPLDFKENTLKDANLCYFLDKRQNHELKKLKKEKIRRQIDRKFNTLTDAIDSQQEN